MITSHRTFEATSCNSRSRIRALALAGACLTLIPFAGAQGSSAPEIVGAFELAAPQEASFILHGTLPLPRNTFPRADGQMPLSIVDSGGATVPAQVEHVSSYPDDSLGSDVVEVIARVTRPAGAAPGDRIQYRVITQVQPAQAPSTTPLVAQLLSTPGAVTLSARDVFNHVYSADLLRGSDGHKTLRSGGKVVQTRNYEVMRPVGGPIGPPNGALPHFMGVHAYVTSWQGEDLVSVDLRVHNGTSGADSSDASDNPQAKLYFDSLDVRVPLGWTVLVDWRDPAQGSVATVGSQNVLQIIEKRSDGTLNVLPVQSQFQRRMVITRVGNEARARSMLDQEWLGFCRRGVSPTNKPYWSWWNRQTARYFPQRHVLPNLDHLNPFTTRAKDTNLLKTISNLLVHGGQNGGPIFVDALGWAHPWGVKYGGMTGGTEIYLYDGITTADAASLDGYRLAQLRLRMYLDRHPTALYNKDGEPTQLSDWVIHGPQFDYVFMQFYTVLLAGNDPFGFANAPTFQTSYVAANGLVPPYEVGLLAFFPIDLQHQIRLTHSAKTLAWLGNDALAKDELRMQAAIVQLSYHELPTSPSGATIGTGLLADIQAVHADPGVGFNFGRGEGWSVDTMNAAYSLGDPAFRQKALPWFNKIVAVVRDGQADCSGLIQRLLTSKILHGSYFARKSIEAAIVENALWGAKESVYAGVNPGAVQTINDILAKSFYGMIGYPSWNPTQHGPWSALAVAPADPLQPPYCGFLPPNGTSGGVDKFQVWSSFAYAYELTGDLTFLDRALEMTGGGGNLLAALLAGKYKNLENRAALIALMQMGP
jgi:hypothetical protein